MNISERVHALRKKMADRGLEAYVIPTSDPHQSEYVTEYYKTREYISGFTGSAGVAVVTRTKAGLWTDSRYFLQAAEELKGSPFTLYRLFTDDMSVTDFLKNEVSPFGKIGFDGWCMSTAEYKKYANELGQRLLVTDVDYIGEIWTDRPLLPEKKAYRYPEEYAGASVREKLSILRYMMKDRDADVTFIGAPEDVCYLYNFRGWDVAHTPVVLSYTVVTKDQAVLFVDASKLTDEIRTSLEDAGVTIYRYEAVYEYLAKIEGQTTVYLNPLRTNITLYQALRDNVRIKRGENLTTLMKAIKSETEIKNIKEAYIKDGVALVRFFNWVETGAKTGMITEKNAVERLHAFRKDGEDFLDDSFSSIIGYGSNAAIVHYNPLKQKVTKKIENRGLLLVDSGGHYLQGTTDITRTYAMGPLSHEEQTDYTLVLKAHIAGMKARFLPGTTGMYIDAITKEVLWAQGKSFFHGTGHGVGHLLSVHEGPQSFSAKSTVEIVPGMVTSMEPGLYIEGSHGIRIETITLCVKDEKTDFGAFYALEPLTYVPIDTRPVLRSMLHAEEAEWLDDYNRTCFEKLSPYLEGEELEYLEKCCQPIG